MFYGYAKSRKASEAILRTRGALAFWHSFDEAQVDSNGRVYTLPSKTKNVNLASLNGSANIPLLVTTEIPGRGVGYFDDARADQLREDFGFWWFNSGTFFALCKPTATQTNYTEANSGTNGTSGLRYLVAPWPWISYPVWGLSVATNGISYVEHGGSYLPTPLTYVATLTGWMVVCLKIDTLRTPKLYIDGSLVRTGISTQGQSNAYLYGPGVIGAHGYGNYKGYIAEYAGYHNTLSDADIYRISRDMKNRWGV